MNNSNIRGRVDSAIAAIIHWIEILLAFFIILAVILNIKDTIFFIYNFFTSNDMSSFDAFTPFLEHVLLLIIGLELTETLITHTPGSLVGVILYAIARKMLIQSANAYELFAGAAAIGILFATKKYFISE